MYKVIFLLSTICACLATTNPVYANQWVAGNVANVADFGNYNSGQSGLRITLVNKTWGGGDTSNGLAVCTEDFRVVIGMQGVTEEIKNRFWSAALIAYSTSRKIMFYVDTGTSAPYCAIEIVRLSDGPVP